MKNTLRFRVRRGKIARLPRHLRDELNLRLEDGEPGPALLAWLNALPEVQAVLAAQFAGRPINQQNLTEWRQGGWQDWMQEQSAFEAAARIPEEAREAMPSGAARPPLVETLAHWLSMRYVLATRRIADTEGPEGWRLLREMTHDVVRLQRLDTRSRHLARQQEIAALTAATQRPPSPPRPKPVTATHKSHSSHKSHRHPHSNENPPPHANGTANPKTATPDTQIHESSYSGEQT